MNREKTTLIVGGSRGIGRELALDAGRLGIKPTVVARNFREDDSELRAYAQCVTADVSDTREAAWMFQDNVLDADYVFWVAGAFLRGRVIDVNDSEIERIVMMHQVRMVAFLRDIVRHRIFQKNRSRLLPIRLGVIGSVASFLPRKDEAVYGMAKAGQAAFLRQFVAELDDELPGSRIILANCARLGSSAEADEEDSGGMRINPGHVARNVWERLRREDAPRFQEVNFFRDSRGTILQDGTCRPEST